MISQSIKAAIVLAVTILCIPFISFSQCAECPVGSTLISGSTNISDQNNATDYCIDATWTWNLRLYIQFQEKMDAFL
jgi:hypothetical protein